MEPPIQHTALPLQRSNHLHLHAARGKCSNLLAHAVTNTREHSGTTTEDNITVQILSDIDVTLHDHYRKRLNFRGPKTHENKPKLTKIEYFRRQADENSRRK
jgi:hypothetical protein